VDRRQEVATKGQEQTSGVHYVIPARTIAGSPEEMLTEIDDVVHGLLALRHLIATQKVGVGSGLAGGSRPRSRLWPRRLYGARSANR
jgi:hypothetical protein